MRYGGAVEFSPDGSRIVCGSEDKVRMWDVSSGAKIWERPENVVADSGNHHVIGTEIHFKSVSFSPDGSKVVTGSDDNTIRVWNSNTGDELLEIELTVEVNSVSFSPDGRRVVSGSDDGTVRVWNILGSYRVWNSTSGELLKTLEGHTSGVSSVAFSPNGRRVVSGSYDNTVRVWNASSGECVLTLVGHTDRVWSVSFSPDGSKIVSGSGDKTVRVWDYWAETELVRLDGHMHWVMSVSFSPDGSRIVSGSGDKTVRVWDFAAIEYATMADDDSESDYSNLFGSDDSDDDERPHHPVVVPPDEACVICMEKLSNTSNGYAVKLNCGHYFHADCIRGWQNAGESKSEGYEEGVTFLQSGYQMPGKKCPLCRVIAKDNTYADGILRLRF